MACQINRNRQGEIEEVLTPEGAQSALFAKVSSHPLIQNSEEALGVYMGAYSEKIGGNEGEITFVNKANGQIYNSYKSALENTSENGTIEVGFEKGGQFFPIVKTEKSTNKNTETGFINKSILDGKIKDTKKRVRNSYKFEAGGETEVFQMINTEIIFDEAKTYLGVAGIGKEGMTFDFKKTSNKVKLRDKQGKIQYISSEYFNTETFSKIKSEWGVDAAIGAVVGREWVTHLNNNQEKVMDDGPKRTERQLQLLLMRMLENMGVKTMSILEYTEKYKKRRGVDPSAKALADIANQVIALRDGTIDTDTLLEETAHFINEAMPQDQVENLLRNIHKTEEWTEFSEQYKAIYARDFQTQEEIDEAVRREVLGKVLANSLRNNFELTEETSEAKAGIIEYLREAVNTFLTRVNNFFKNEFQQDLNNYTQQVEDLLFEQTLGSQLDTSQFKDNKFRLYEVENNNKGTAEEQAIEKIRRISIPVINTIRGSIHKAYRAEGTSVAVDSMELNRLEEELNTNEFKNSVAGLIKMSNNYIRRLRASIEKDSKTPFSSEQRIIFQTLKTTLIPGLSEMERMLEKTGIERSEARRMSDEIRNLNENMRVLTADASLHASSAVMELTERVMRRHNMPEAYREHVEKWVDLAEKDSTFFHAHFGQVSHSRDPMLGLMGVIAKDMAMEENLASIGTINNTISRLKEWGFDHKVVSQFLDKDAGMLISERDMGRYYSDLENIYLEELREKNKDKKGFFNKSVKRGEDIEMTKEDILKDKISLESKMSTSELTDMRAKVSKRGNELRERAMEDSYYEKLENNMDKVGLSEKGRNFINSYYRNISSYNRKALKDGVVDLTTLEEGDKLAYNDIKMERAEKKSFYDSVGDLKEGLMENEEGEVVPDPAKELSTGAEMAIDLNKFDKSFIRDVETFEQDFKEDNGRNPNEQEINEFKESQEKEIDPVFWEMLTKAFERSAEDGMEFLRMNSHINFSSEFWDSLAESKSLTEKLGSQIEVEKGNDLQKAAEMQETLDALKKEGKSMREILKKYRNSSNPSEIVTELMPSTTRNRVKELQESLSLLYSKASGYVESTEQEGREVQTMNETNMSYHKIIKDKGLTELTNENILKEAEFAKDHMTSSNYASVVSAMDFISKIKKGVVGMAPNRAVARVMEEVFPGRNLQELGTEETNIIERKIIRDRLLPYYRRFSPKSYEAFTNILSLKNTDKNTVEQKVKQVKDGMGGEITITPTRTFLESTGENDRNSNFVTNYYGGVEQPKMSMYKSEKFHQMFGNITYDNPDDYLSGRPEKNAKLYEAYKIVLEWNKVGLDAKGVGESFNYFTAPQIRKGSIQRVVDLTKNVNGRSIKEAYENMVTFTPDEMVKGETNFGDTVKIIPMQYIRKLQNPQDISTDLFYSIAARNAEGFKRETRLKHYGDIMALSDTVSARTTGNGKDVKATNTYKMLESFIDYNLFGIKESWSYEVDTKIFGKVDLAKMLRKLVTYIKFKNLGLNLIIPITSALTTKVQMSIERIVGEHVDSRSVTLARKEMPKLLKEAMKDFNTIGKTSELTVMGQYFRAFDIADTLKDSSYSGLARIWPKIGMGLHGLSNFPLYGEAMLTTLHDYRIIRGSLLNRRQFERLAIAEAQKEGKEISKAEIKTEWNANEGESLRKHISVKEGELIFDKEALRDKMTNSEGLKMSEEAFEGFFEEKIKGVQSRIGEVILNIDQQIPMETRVAAQRSALTSIFLTHKSFLITNLSRRTRSEFWNPLTGEHEAGTYSSNANFIGDAIDEMRKTGSRNFYKAIKEQWKTANKEQRMNIRRSMADVSILTLMGIIGYMMFAFADDDSNEENYGIQSMAYFYQRLLNESSSMQMIGTVTTLNETVSSPIVGMQIIEGLTEYPKIFSSDEIDRGAFKGQTERYRYMTKMMPLFSNINYLKDAQSLKGARGSYRMYNASTIDANPFMWAANKMESDE